MNTAAIEALNQIEEELSNKIILTRPYINCQEDEEYVRGLQDAYNIVVRYIHEAEREV